MDYIDCSDKKTVDCPNKKTGVIYVYEVLDNYWDKEKQQSRSKRKLLGRRDPESGLVIPTTRKSASASSDSPDYKALYKTAQKDLAKRDQEIAELKEKLASSQSFLLELQKLINSQIHS